MTEPSVKLPIIVFVRHYLPGFKSGGPLRSIFNLTEALSDEFDFKIVTSDRDAGDRRPYSSLTREKWQVVGNAEVCYLPPERQTFLGFRTLLSKTPHRAIYLNSFFDPLFTTLPMLVRRLGLAPQTPVLLAPRGEFSKGALELKVFKKRAFIYASRLSGWHNDCIWQASSSFEMKDILREMPGAAVRVASDVAIQVSATALRSPRQQGDPLRVIFLSRITPKKNLDYALRVLGKVRQPVVLSIYGSVDEPRYWNECERLIAALPPNVKAIYGGSVEPDQVHALLALHDLFLLPTRGENFGHVIAEALAAGTRALISDQTPWRGLAVAGVGYDLPLTKEDEFVNALEAEASSEVPHEEIKRLAEAYLNREVPAEAVLQSNRELLRALTRSPILNNPC